MKDQKKADHMKTSNFNKLLLLDILSGGLQKADRPKELGISITSTLRELTGAKLAVIYQCNHNFGGEGHKMISLNPERRLSLLKKDEIDKLFDNFHFIIAPKLLKKNDYSDIIPDFVENDSIICPLDVGEHRVGFLMIFDLPEDPMNMNNVVSIMDSMATTIALILRNAILSEEQEKIIDKRTSEYRNANRKLLKEIDERKKTEKALIESESRFEEIAHNVNEVFWVVENIKDQDYQVTYVSPAFEKLWQIKPEELYEDNSIWYSSIIQQDRKRVSTAFKNFIEGKGKYNIQFRIERKDGKFKDILSRGKLIKDKNGKLVKAIGINQDFTEINEIQSQLNHKFKMDSLGKLAGGIAHDFNNQLSAIMGFAELLSSELEDENLKFYSDNILLSANRSSEITAQLLAFSRKDKMTMVPFDIHEILNELIKMLKHSMSKKVIIENQWHAKDTTIRGDKSQLQNALLNLAINANDAMQKGGTLTIITENETIKTINKKGIPEGKYIKIKVKDSGEGIKKEIIEDIFTPYFTTKPEGKGTGIGLSRVFSTVKSHNGDIDVESKPGQGTTFTILIPVINKEVAKNLTPKTTNFHTSGNIMIIDDEEIICNLISTVVESFGLTPTTFHYGESAVDYYKKNSKNIDYVICDWRMPDINGKDTFSKMKKVDSDIKFILISGYLEENETKDLKKEGYSGFLPKPFTDLELATLLQSLG